MYAIYIVRRTQIYLDEGQATRLRVAAKARRRTVSQLIREAIDDKLNGADGRKGFEAALSGVTGIWAGRKDIGSADAYVRRVRRDRRGASAR